MLANALTVRFDLMQHYEAEVARLHKSAVRLNARCQQLSDELLLLMVCRFKFNNKVRQNVNIQESTSSDNKGKIPPLMSTDTRRRRVVYPLDFIQFHAFLQLALMRQIAVAQKQRSRNLRLMLRVLTQVKITSLTLYV